MTNRRPTITRGPASAYAAPAELVREFSDGASGGLISIMRNAQGQLVVDIGSHDADVIVRVGKPRS